MIDGALLTVFGFLVVFTLVALFAGTQWHRIDQLERTNRALVRDNGRLTDLLDQACQERDEATANGREWMALANEHTADLIDHQHRCLGVLVQHDSGVPQ